MRECSHKTIRVEHREGVAPHVLDVTCACSPALACMSCDQPLTMARALTVTPADREHGVPRRTYLREAMAA